MASNDIPVTINGHTVVGTAKIYLDAQSGGVAVITLARGAAFLEELALSNLTGVSFTSPYSEVNDAVNELLLDHPLKDLSSRIDVEN